ncbi:pyridoxine 5'-phosphate synthase [Prolixibacter sp. NT017]|uniref:pyridoxine 5'-phosphate synthase n=1 Tax=Prolixibacter sp. NT017 TaxID=2652390 RepID=UPI0012792AFF|nr:pyridoxine 5'-phosphate synthase [Prolixibacter sp. NT017]GET26243.1 pyridoxine 5'-phosphate synthase [Prolixibacter sp. NT017]
MTRLSVNINKIATLRNSRGGNIPNVLEAAMNCEKFGAEGITVHPRPDERHIRYSDVRELRPLITTEFNIEGYPSKKFMDLVLEVKPHQVTLVPDAPDAVTSNAGWNTLDNKEFLTEVVSEFKKAGIRTSLFVGTEARFIEGAAKVGADRVELYTEPYATDFPVAPEKAIAPFIHAAEVAIESELGLNAGHDLSLENLRFFYQNIPGLLEVSIGHALISEAIYLGLELTILKYKECLR